MNVGDVATALNLPQSTVATNIKILEQAGLIETRLAKGRQGQQKVCRVPFGDIVLSLRLARCRRLRGTWSR